jgi:hypothetical protein
VNVVDLWKVVHQDDNGTCTCGEPTSDCIFHACLFPAQERAMEQMYADLFDNTEKGQP